MKIRRLVVSAATLFVGAAGLLVPVQAQANVDIYSTPGVHLVSGRHWQTQCTNYSTTVVRCTTDIFATKVFLENGQWFKQNTWAFNNLSYLPSSRTAWAGNPLGSAGSWTSTDGRTWRTECDTAATGRGACRNYIVGTVASETGGVVKQETKEVFNSMVRFTTSSVAPVTQIPAAAPYLAPPVPGVKQPIGAVPKPAPAALVQKPTTPAKAPAPAKSTRSAPSGWDCPSTHPIKGNADSGIYHMRGGRYYERTNPEECFATERAAVDAGYRRSKA